MELIDSQFAVSLDAAMRSVEGIGPWLEAGWPTDAACVPARSGGASDSRSLSRTSIPPRVHSLRHMHHAQRHCLAARITGGHIWVTPPGSPTAMSDSTAQTSGFGLMLTQA